MEVQIHLRKATPIQLCLIAKIAKDEMEKTFQVE